MKCDNKTTEETVEWKERVREQYDKVGAHFKQCQPFFNTEQYLLYFFCCSCYCSNCDPTFIFASETYLFQVLSII